METLIARSTKKTERLFPPITPELYSPNQPSGLTADQQAAQRLLALGNRNFGPWQRLMNRKLDSAGKLSRLLFHHRMAMQAELEGQAQRADFFWRELHRDIRPLCNQPDVWEALAKTFADQADVTVLNDPAQLRRHLVEEILIDTHCAFYNGRAKTAEKLPVEDRAFAQFDYLTALLEVSDVSRAAVRTLIVAPAESRLERSKEARQWASAIQACSLLLQHFSDHLDYQDEMASLHFLSTVDSLTNGPAEWQCRRDADKLQDGIASLEKLLKGYPYNPNIYQVLGHLHHLHAIKLTNSGSLSEGLVSAQKAVTFYPTEEVEATRQKLLKMMQDLQEQIRQLRREVANQPNARLSTQGQRMKKEAMRGLQPMTTYMQSGEAKQTAENFYIARARNLWKSIGLAEPAAQWNEQALALLDGMGQVINRTPADSGEISTMWHGVASADARLADLDGIAICAFLRRRLLEQADEAPAAARSLPSPVEPPLLEAKPATGKQAAEPFIYWLLSRENLRLKFQAALAILLLLMAGTLSLRETLARHSRDAAYRQIIAALDNQSHLNTIEGAETFLGNKPLLGKDGRESKVMNYYNEALVRWLVQQNNEADATVLAHLNRYRQLVAAR